MATNAMGMGADLKGPSNNVLFHPHRSMLVWIRLVIHSSINNLITNGAHVGIWRFSCWRDLKISNFDLYVLGIKVKPRLVPYYLEIRAIE